MKDQKTCAECGGTNLEDEPEEFALIALSSDGRIEIHLNKPRTSALVVRARACVDCGRVALFRVA